MNLFRTIFLSLTTLIASLALLSSCKEKNNEYQPRSWSEYSYQSSEIKLRDISSILYENDHSIWLGAKGSEGLLHYDGYTWNVYNSENTGIDFDSITSMSRDGNGRLWVGWKSGLAALDGSTWQKISQFEGFRVTSVVVEGIADIRVGIKGESGGMASLQNNTWRFETIHNSEIPSGDINSLVSDHEQVIWLETADKSIIRLKNSKWESMTGSLQLLSQNFTAITKASDGSIWAGTDVSQLIHFTTDTYNLLNTGTSKLITAIVTDDEKTWCSMLGAGIIKFDGQDWTSYSSDNASMPSDEIVCMAVANPGYLIFSVPGGKLYLLKQ